MHFNDDTLMRVVSHTFNGRGMPFNIINKTATAGTIQNKVTIAVVNFTGRGHTAMAIAEHKT